MKGKTKKLIGHILLLGGLAIPLFASLAISLKPSQLKEEYIQYKVHAQQRPESDFANRDKKAQAYNDSLTDENNIVDPWTADEYQPSYQIFDQDNDQAFAYISIPVLGQTQPIYLGASQENLRKGFVHIDGTSLPIGGRGNRSVISGHRSTLIDVTLLHADKIQEGDLLFIDLGDQVLEYEMVSQELIYPYQWQELRPVQGSDLVTLLTCDPVYPPFDRRLLVNFERVDQEEGPSQSLNSQVKDEAPSQDPDKIEFIIEEIHHAQETKPQVASQEKISKILAISLSIVFILVLISLLRLIKKYIV